MGAVSTIAVDWVERTIPAAFREVYAERQSEYGLSNTELGERLMGAGKDGFWFLRQIEQSAPPAVNSLAEVKVLRTVLEQQFPKGKDGPPATKRPGGRDIIESPHEPEARRGNKGERNWIGYKGQVTETCDQDRPHLIMDLEGTGALETDSLELPKIQVRLSAQETLPGEQYGDQSYISGQNIAESAALGIDLVGKPRADTHTREGFRQSDFQIDEAKRQVSCPGGETSSVWSERSNETGRPKAVEVRFDGPTCQACRFFGKCTNSEKGRSLELNAYRAVLEARREEAQSEAYREKQHLRAGIESAISELVRGYGLRHSRYRGKRKLVLQCLFTALAANLRRLARWWAKEGERLRQGKKGVTCASPA